MTSPIPSHTLLGPTRTRARDWVPGPIGPLVIFSTDSTMDMYRGWFASFATNANAVAWARSIPALVSVVKARMILDLYTPTHSPAPPSTPTPPPPETPPPPQ